MRKYPGFTLIELVTVMVILGILAAFAIPKFYSFRSESRAAIVKALAGAIRDNSNVAHAASLALNNPVSISMDGTPIAMTLGYPSPTIDGIVAAVSINDIFTPGCDAGVSCTFNILAAPDSCQVRYFLPASSTTPPVMEVNTFGC